MKKKIVGLALIALIASLFVIKEKQTKYSMSDLSMANIEALARGEGLIGRDIKQYMVLLEHVVSLMHHGKFVAVHIVFVN